jgi:hypothetical protein
MSGRVVRLWGALVLLSAPACAKKALQELDGGGGGILPTGGGGAGAGNIDGGGAIDVGATGGAGGGGVGADAAWDAPISGRKAYVVTSQVGAMNNVSTSHTFTMVLDTDQRTAIVGTWGDARSCMIQPVSDRIFGLAAPLSFGVSVPTAACGASVRYDDVRFTIDSQGILSGNGRGVLTTSDGINPAAQLAATMNLVGVPDTEAPSLSLSGGGSLADPWSPIWLVASEPLPSDQLRPVLRSTGGDVINLESINGTDPFAIVFGNGSRMLRFADQYLVTTDGIQDFAGNRPMFAGDATFTTRLAPPLVPDSGFETVTDATLGGAQILSGSGAPTISGAQSFYVPPVESLGTAAPVSQFALRVPLSPGDTEIRFSYRNVNPGAASAYLVFGSVGGTIGTATLDGDGGGTYFTIGGIQVVVGSTRTVTVGLPDDARGELVLTRIASQPVSCGGGPMPRPIPGLIIDDLRGAQD